MISLTLRQIDDTMPRIREGLEKYLDIMRRFRQTDVSRDAVFQKQFNHFYRIRRHACWRKDFYWLLEHYKNQKEGFSFASVLDALYQRTQRYEASFASKLVATIDPSQPVIDKFVLKNAGLRLPYPRAKDRKKRIIECYDELSARITKFLATQNGQYLVKQFQKRYPFANITAVKMVDLVLWQFR